MASEEPTVVVEEAVPEEPVADAANPPEEENDQARPAAKPKKARKEPKPKKPAAPRSRNPPTHPPYEEVRVSHFKLNNPLSQSRFPHC